MNKLKPIPTKRIQIYEKKCKEWTKLAASSFQPLAITQTAWPSACELHPILHSPATTAEVGWPSGAWRRERRQPRPDSASPGTCAPRGSRGCGCRRTDPTVRPAPWGEPAAAVAPTGLWDSAKAGSRQAVGAAATAAAASEGLMNCRENETWWSVILERERANIYIVARLVGFKSMRVDLGNSGGGWAQVERRTWNAYGLIQRRRGDGVPTRKVGVAEQED